MSNKMLKKILSVLSSAVIVTPTLVSSITQASDYDVYNTKTSSSENSIAKDNHECHDHEHCHECDGKFMGTGKGVKIALLDAGVTEYNTYKHVSFINDDTVGSDHGDLMMSILSEKVPDADIMDVRVLDDDGKGTYSDVSKGIHWAVDNDADIIVMSFAGESNSSLLGEAVEYADNNNVFVVAAAGNSSCEKMFFPAAFDTVISVGAIDTDGNIYDFSNFGRYVDTYGENSNGTSGAAQTIAASVAVAMEYEGNISAAELRQDFQLNPKTFVRKSDEENADAVVYAAVCNHRYEANWQTVVKPTCTKEGKQIRACMNGCGERLEQSIPATGHKAGSWVTTVQPTCTSAGKKVCKCAVCGDVIDSATIPANGHDWDNWYTAKEATCSAEGVLKRYCKTYGCSASETKAITNKPAHKSLWVTTVQPTCKSIGKKVYQCSECKAIFDTKTIPQTGHDWEDWRVVNKATCTKEGLEKRVCKTYGCHEEETRVIPKDDHRLTSFTVKEPTCTEKGLDQWICMDCKKVVKEDIMSANGHKWGEWTVAKKATCTENGFEKRVCRTCKKEETRSIPKDDHRLTSITVKEPTCTEKGLDQWVCMDCKKVVKEDVLAANGHKYSWVTTVQPTCTSNGKKENKCSVCGKVSDTDTISKTGHDWENWRVIKEPVSCSEPGKKQRACKKYGCHAVETEEITIPHKNSWITTVQPTCTTKGKKVLKCSVCGHVSKTDTIPELGHDFEHWRIVKSATCTEKGLSERTCKRYGCHYTDKTEPEALGHNYQYKIIVHPDEFNKGLEEEICTRCQQKSGNKREIGLVDFEPVDFDKMTPLAFKFDGQADDEHFSQKVETYNGKKVVSITFKSNYEWSITAPSYVNIYDKTTGKSVKEGKEGTHTLYVWIDYSKLFDDTVTPRQLTFNIEGEKYSCPFDEFEVYNENYNEIPTSFNDYFDNVKEFANSVKSYSHDEESEKDANEILEYLSGRKLTNGEIKIFKFDDSRFIAISSDKKDEKFRINYSKFCVDKIPYPNQMDIKIEVENSCGMKFVQDGGKPVIETEYKIDASSLHIEDEIYNEKSKDITCYADFVGFLEDLAIPEIPGGFLANYTKDTVIGYATDEIFVIDNSDIPNNTSKPIIYKNEAGFAEDCSMNDGNNFGVTCYGQDLIQNVGIHFNIVDANENTVIFDRTYSVKSRGYNSTPPMTTTSNVVYTTITTAKTTSTTAKTTAATTPKAAVTTTTPKAAATTTTPKAAATTTTTKATATTTTTKAAATTTTTKATATTTTTKAAATTTTAVTTTVIAQPSLGDLNADGKVNAVDATNILSVYVKIAVEKISSTSDEISICDVNKDGAVNAVDASYVLSYYAYTSTNISEAKMSFDEYMNNN